MAVTSKDLGPVTAYAAAVNRGYTGTREEFETLMASYATVAEEAAASASDAIAAKNAAISAKDGAVTASSNASTYASRANTWSENARNHRVAAHEYADAAEASATAAQTAQTAAEVAQAGAETAVDGFDEAVTEAISDVNTAGTNQKELAKRQAEKSEAWAVGEINGEDVGISDPAYHNNSKYYAEQTAASSQQIIADAAAEKTAAQTARQGAEAAESNASASATAAAASAADAAASAQTFVIDDTLTEPGQAADAKAVGYELFTYTYNLVDCNSTKGWTSPSNKQVTVSIPEADTVRVKSDIEQTYAVTSFYVDTENISNLYAAMGNYTGTGQARGRIYGVSSPTDTLLGIIPKGTGTVFDVSTYDRIKVELAATTNTASTGYMDYAKVIVADSDVALPYIAYDKISRIETIEADLEAVGEKAETALNAIGAVRSKFIVAHRGAEKTAPENTMPSFILARELGFRNVETDVRFTSDSIPVLLHDGTINRTARNADGSVISQTLEISDITYEQASAYDYGIAKGEKYAGTKIPTLAEFLRWCKVVGMSPCIEQKVRNTSNIDATILALQTAGITDNFTILAAGIGTLERFYNSLPKGRYVYLLSGVITETDISDVASSPASPILMGNYTNLTSEIINLCRQYGVSLYAFLYSTFDAIYSADDYISGYVVSNGAI